MPLLRISYPRANALLQRQTDAIPLLNGMGRNWYATAAGDVVGCVLPARDAWRFVLFSRDGRGAYLKVADNSGYESDAAAYEALAAERLKMLPPPPDSPVGK